VLPPGEFNSIIPILLPIYSSRQLSAFSRNIETVTKTNITTKKQEAQLSQTGRALSQTGRAMLHDIQYFAMSLTVTQGR